ncbi:hypothetical protein ACFL6P_08365 [Candidatus Latescibacterota bacterium]
MNKATIGQRRWYFIKSTFNLRLLFVFLIIMVIGLCALGFLLYFMSSSELDVKLFEAHSRIMSSWEILSPTIFLTIVTAFILIFIITLIMMLAVSHKLAGPLFKFEMVAEQIGKGNFRTNVRLRKKDKVIHLQNALENMLYNLNGKIKNFKRNYLKIKKMEDDLFNAVNASTLSEEEKAKLVKTMQAHLEEYKSNLDSFTLRELELSKLPEPYRCPIHTFIGICPEYDYAKDRESKQKKFEIKKAINNMKNGDK